MLSFFNLPIATNYSSCAVDENIRICFPECNGCGTCLEDPAGRERLLCLSWHR